MVMIGRAARLFGHPGMGRVVAFFWGDVGGGGAACAAHAALSLIHI